MWLIKNKYKIIFKINRISSSEVMGENYSNMYWVWLFKIIKAFFWGEGGSGDEGGYWKGKKTTVIEGEKKSKFRP